jgi:hypothetical protein
MDPRWLKSLYSLIFVALVSFVTMQESSVSINNAPDFALLRRGHQ